MASSTPHTIVLSDQPFVQVEYKSSGGTITPGDIIELASATTVRRHATTSGNAQALFATENPFAEPSSSAAIDTNYGTIDTVYAIAGRSGDQIYAWLEPNGSVNAGQYLESAGTVGALQLYVAGTAEATHSIVAKALENKTASSSRVRIKVEVI
jgi:hypothetical protein